MKKKIFAVIAAIMLLVVIGAFFTACDDPNTVELSATVVVGDKVYNIEDVEFANNAKLIDAINYLVENEDLHLKLGTGGFVQEIGNLIPSADKNEFISIYTSNEADKAIGFGDTLDYNGTTMYTCGFGASDGPLVDGIIYKFVIRTY